MSDLLSSIETIDESFYKQSCITWTSKIVKHASISHSQNNNSDQYMYTVLKL